MRTNRPLALAVTVSALAVGTASLAHADDTPSPIPSASFVRQHIDVNWSSSAPDTYPQYYLAQIPSSACHAIYIQKDFYSPENEEQLHRLQELINSGVLTHGGDYGIATYTKSVHYTIPADDTKCETPSPTPSETPTPTPTPSVTTTPSETPSPSETPTPIPSVTATPSPSISDTPSPTASVTPSPSNSPSTTSPSPSESTSPSTSTSPSQSASASPSVSHSASVTPSSSVDHPSNSSSRTPAAVRFDQGPSDSSLAQTGSNEGLELAGLIALLCFIGVGAIAYIRRLKKGKHE